MVCFFSADSMPCFPRAPTSLYLSPRRQDPLQPLVLGAAPQDTRLLGFGFVVLPAHAVGHHHGSGPGISAAAEDAPLPQATAAGLGALRADGQGKGAGQGEGRRARVGHRG